MAQTNFRTAYILSAVIAVLMIIASAGGLFLDGLYRDNVWVTTQWRGSDLVRLIVAIPTLTAALILSLRGSQRAQLIWLGMLWLAVYDYTFYLFAAAFNPFFLIYVALFSLSILALIFALPHVDVDRIRRHFGPRTPVKLIGGYMLFVAGFLGSMWIARTLHFLTTGQVPQDIINSGHPTGVVYALDLGVVVPSMVLGALWLWQRRPWGYVIGAMMLVKATVYPLALIGMGLFQAITGVPGAWDMMPFWIFFAIVSLIASGFFFGNMRFAAQPDHGMHHDHEVDRRGRSGTGARTIPS